MIDKILPCPRCGIYPCLSVATEETSGKYYIRTNCYCIDKELKDICDSFNIERLSDNELPIIELIQWWNYAVSNMKTVEINISDLKILCKIINDPSYTPGDIFNELENILIKYLPGGLNEKR